MNTDGLTREQVLELKPGRELDALVIRHIMNIPVVESVDLFSQEPFPAAWWVEDEGWYIADERDEDGLIYRPFNPSEDIAAAFEAETKVIEKDPSMYVHALASVVFGYSQVQDISDIRKMCMLIHATPEQRCKATLLVVMGE